MRRNDLALALLVGFAGSAACSTNSGRAPASPPAAARNVVTVTNDNWLDVTVYAIRGTARTRLGFVNSHRTRTFTLPHNASIGGVVRLLVDPLGTDATFLTDGIVVTPGQRIQLTVRPGLSMTTFAVWRR